jgi:hypothetical protein
MLFKPMRFFTPVVLLLFILGIIKMIFVDQALGDNHISESTVMIMLTSLIVFAIGVLAEIQVRLFRPW